MTSEGPSDTTVGFGIMALCIMRSCIICGTLYCSPRSPLFGLSTVRLHGCEAIMRPPSTSIASAGLTWTELGGCDWVPQI